MAISVVTCTEPPVATVHVHMPDTIKRSRRSGFIGSGLCAVLLAACAARAPTPPPDQVVDWTRYLGTWYEIARFDHGFERGLVGVTATYSAMPDGRVAVLNAGHARTLAGKKSTATATAKITGPASLSVTFFWPFSGDYRVLALADDYRWAVVGSSTMAYLWFLHRTPRPPADDVAAMELAAKAAGYDLTGLIRVEQRAPGTPE